MKNIPPVTDAWAAAALAAAILASVALVTVCEDDVIVSRDLLRTNTPPGGGIKFGSTWEHENALSRSINKNIT